MSKGVDVNTFAIGGTARIRQALEQAINGRKRGIAARDLKVSLPELTFYVTGSRSPTAQRLLDLANYLRDSGRARDFSGSLDQLLIENGMAPAFFKHAALADGKVLVLRDAGNGGYSLPSEEDPPFVLSELLADIRLACRHPGAQVAMIGEGTTAVYLLLEPVTDDCDVPDGEVALFAIEDNLYFGRLERSEDPDKLSFHPFDPVSMTPRAKASSKKEDDETEINLLARVLLHFKAPRQSAADSAPKPAFRVAPRINKSMDVLQIGIAPFQDSLLTSIGVEMGFFHEEGLAVTLEPVDWYDWQGWFERVEGPALLFSNIFSFVRQYGDMPNLRFLYGVNLFQGFAIQMKSGAPTQGTLVEDSIAYMKAMGTVHVGTIAESDWAAQLYTFCKDNDFNLKVSYGPYDVNVHTVPGALTDHPTMIIEDAHTHAGVISDPDYIRNKYDFYMGSLPQKIRLEKDYGWKTLIHGKEMPLPSPVNGFVGTDATWKYHQDVVLRFLRVWFRIVNYIQPELDDTIHFDLARDAQTGSRLVQRAFENKAFASGTAKLKIDPATETNEIVDAWKQESFPQTPFRVSESILKGAAGKAPWQCDAIRALDYLAAYFGKKDPTLTARWSELSRDITGSGDLFLLEEVQRAYIEKYGSGKVIRKNLVSLPRPELVKIATNVRSK